MRTREEEEHAYEAIIKTLTKALTDIKGSPMDSLKPPTFDWNSSDSLKNLDSSTRAWRAGTHSNDKAGDTIQLEYLLNFLGPIG